MDGHSLGRNMEKGFTALAIIACIAVFFIFLIGIGIGYLIS